MKIINGSIVIILTIFLSPTVSSGQNNSQKIEKLENKFTMLELQLNNIEKNFDVKIHSMTRQDQINANKVIIDHNYKTMKDLLESQNEKIYIFLWAIGILISTATLVLGVLSFFRL